jgi:hypothetical protein
VSPKARRAAGLGAAGALALGALLLFRWERTPLLTAETLAAARARWEAAPLRDYDLTISKVLDVRAPEIIHTEVRGGKATQLDVDGSTVSLRDSYTVPGLFDVLGEELAIASSKNPLPGQPHGAILRARFVDGLGFPVVLKRIASNRQSYTIVVLRLEVPGGQVLWPLR